MFFIKLLKQWSNTKIFVFQGERSYKKNYNCGNEATPAGKELQKTFFKGRLPQKKWRGLKKGVGISKKNLP